MTRPMYVNSSNSLHGPQSLAAPHRAYGAQSAPRSGSLEQVDQLDISPQAAEASRTRESGDIRQDKVAALKASIADGSYDTPEKLDIALSRMLDAIG